MTSLIDNTFAVLTTADEWVKVADFGPDRQAHVRAVLANYSGAPATIDIAVSGRTTVPRAGWERETGTAIADGHSFFPRDIILKAGQALYAKADEVHVSVSTYATLEIVPAAQGVFEQIYHISEAGFTSTVLAEKTSGHDAVWEAYENLTLAASYQTEQATHTFPAGFGNYWKLVLPDNDPYTLETLKIHNAGIVGTVPDLSAFTALRVFYCYSNTLTGGFPDLSANIALFDARFSYNNLGGALPSLSSNVQLVTFQAVSCGLTGSIPSLAANTKLAVFHVQNNDLSGTIPSLAANTKLAQFRVDNNDLTGSLPDLSSNVDLALFYASTNLLTGVIPNLAGAVKLQDLRITGNAVTGVAAGFTIGSPVFTILHASNCALDQAGVDKLYETINDTGTSGGIVITSGPANADPTGGAGNADVIALQGRGFTITL